MYVLSAQYFEKIEAQDISAQNITEQPGCAKLIVVSDISYIVKFNVQAVQTSSLPDCHLLTLNVMFSVSQFVGISLLCH